jgi:hypothetical protein
MKINYYSKRSIIIWMIFKLRIQFPLESLQHYIQFQHGLKQEFDI